MLDKLYKNNPLGVLLLCASIISSGAVMSVELKSVITSQKEMRTEFSSEFKEMNTKINKINTTVSGIQAVNAYKEKIGVN